ncbi:hypothetical protein [Acidovorax sp. NCPPB 4044]|uniref:hypothetical protein n=1 Tax=Acidovorax sp. NCPPB 4044 TaxID=2940490 RepID=UPI0023041EA8|nr:hypothetical protein [Acidovorax sp. NCPPB 4044]MDA8520172.1 hypothetical protein [Acidovorax sp. NCPPB 4044]
MKSNALQIIRATTLSTIFALGMAAPALADGSTAPRVTSPDSAKWIPMIPEMGTKGPSFSIVFGKPGEIGKPFGGMFRVPAGEESPLHTHTSEYWAVMISGVESAREKAGDVPASIPPGATWYQPAKAPHINKCMGPEDCLFYVYYPKGMDYHPVASKP